MKIVPGLSHVDHNLTPDHITWLETRYADRTSFFIDTVQLPETLGEVELGLYGPQVGDEPVPEADVKYIIRGNRRCTSRVVNRPKRMTRQLTVIAGPAEGQEGIVMYTAYGGPCAPREPGDTTIATWEAVQESRAYWAAHALCAE